jgi:hypothetical protein
MPESLRHSRLCEALFQILTRHVGRGGSVGADNFVYFDASHPKRCLAPDAFVKLGVPQALFSSWKTWEKGTPDVCVEILSPSDTAEKLTLRQKLLRYAALGTPEIVVFDTEAPEGRRLRAWDHRGGDLVERIVEGERTPCLALGAEWVLRPIVDLGSALRVLNDGVLVPTIEEAALAERDAERAAKEEALQEVARLRELLAPRR